MGDRGYKSQAVPKLLASAAPNLRENYLRDLYAAYLDGVPAPKAMPYQQWKETNGMRDRFYVFAFLGVLVITAISIAYMDGAIDQHLKEVSDIHADIAQEHAKATYWEGKYQALSHEADWLSVASAEAKFQGGRQ